MNIVAYVRRASLRCAGLLLSFCLNGEEVWGQSDHFYNVNHALWSEVILRGKLNEKFSYQLDYQYRRQGVSDRLEQAFARANGALQAPGSDHPLTYPQQMAIRPWINYQVNERWQVGVSPLGWWGSWSPDTNGRINFQPELRTSLQASLGYSLGRISLTQRVRYEFRFFGRELPTDSAGVGHYGGFTQAKNRRARFRYMLRAQIPLNQRTIEPGTVYVTASDEIFIGIGHQVRPERVFDQNRLWLGLGYKISPVFRLEAGYMNQLIPRGKTNGLRQTDLNHMLLLSLQIDDLNALFRKRAPQD